MNERIHDLAIQAKDWAYADHVGFTAQMLFEQKFAELIIRECISKISTEQDFADQNWQCKSGIHITHELMKHFGVEE
jgi:hypothetical protein